MATRAVTLSRDRPFPGLRPFEFADREFFFGRQDQIYSLYSLLDLSRFIAVIGSSGSGKSSLVRAGLLPLLNDEENWRFATMHPGDEPLVQLADALVTLVPDDGSDADKTRREIRHRRIELALRRSSFGLAAALEEIPTLGNRSLLIVVDQFEELFRYAGTVGASLRKRVADTLWRDQAAHFVQLLLEAARSSDRPIYILLTMRSDFIGDCARYNGLPEAVSAAQFLVPSLKRDEREEVIRKPIEKVGATIEPELVERLLNDIGPELDQLPVLQHCLARIWNRAGKTRHLTLKDYDAVGKIGGALSQHANEVMRSLPGLELGVEQVFRALSERDKEGRATRRALKFDRLLAETGISKDDLVKILDRFRADDCSFILPSKAAVPLLSDDTRIDVVHEALLRRWDAISAEDTGWLAAEEADGRFYRALLALLEGATASEKVTLPLDQVEWRWKWWNARPRTAAWAERYGGHFESVEKLFNDSRAALAAEIARRQAAERRELEAARLEARRTRAWLMLSSAIAAVAIIASLIAWRSTIAAKSAEGQAKVAQTRTAHELTVEKGLSTALRGERATLLSRNTDLRKAIKTANDAKTAAQTQQKIAEKATKAAVTEAHQVAMSAQQQRDLVGSLRLANLDQGLYDNSYDYRISGLVGLDAYKMASTGNAKVEVLPAAIVPSAIGRVALPPWNLGAVTGSGHYVVVITGARQRAYAQPIAGSLLTIDATTLAVLGRTPNVKATMMCGFDSESRVAVESGTSIDGYDILSNAGPKMFASLPVGDIHAFACLPNDRLIFADAGNVLHVASLTTHSNVTIGKVEGSVDGIRLSNSSKLAAITTAEGSVYVYDLRRHHMMQSGATLKDVTTDCSSENGCAGVVAFTSDEKTLAWYDSGHVYTAPIANLQSDASYDCPQAKCDHATLMFGSGATLPTVIADGGVLIPSGTKNAYQVEYDDLAGSQRSPVVDTDFGMYFTAYDPAKALQPNPFGSGLAAQSVADIQGPLLGTIPNSQWAWAGSYGLSGNHVLLPEVSLDDAARWSRGEPYTTQFYRFDLEHLRNGFNRTWSVSYHVQIRDSSDGVHAAAYDWVTGWVRILDISSWPVRTLHAFKIAPVPTIASGPRKGYYTHQTQIAYDPATGIFTIIAYLTTFESLDKYTATGRLVEHLSGPRIMQLSGADVKMLSGVGLSGRGNYLIIKQKYPDPDILLRTNGQRVKVAQSIDAMLHNEKLVLARQGKNDYERVYKVSPWTSIGLTGLPTHGLVAMAPDGRTMAYISQSSGSNSTEYLYLYDLGFWVKSAMHLPGPPDLDTYTNLTFSADGRYLLAAYNDSDNNHRLAIYAVDPSAWIRSGCLMAGRSLSPSEFHELVGGEIPYRDGCAGYENQMYRW
jgi:hypothetical protein